jgi:hypothetical protein
LSGIGYLVPPGGFPNISGNKVSWQGQFYSDQPGITIHWQWAAAAYSTNMSNENSLGVKALHSTTVDCTYLNGDQAGTPENEKAFLVAGGTGGGGSNFTGSYSATATAAVGNCIPPCSNGEERCPIVCTPPPG